MANSFCAYLIICLMLFTFIVLVHSISKDLLMHLSNVGERIQYLLFGLSFSLFEMPFVAWFPNELMALVIFVICRQLNVGEMKDWISLTFRNYVFQCSSHFSVLVILCLFLNETPRFLIEKRRMNNAKVSLRRIRRSGVEAKLQDLATSIERREESALNGPRDWMKASYPERTKLLGISLKMNACSFMSLIMNSKIKCIICKMKI
ncbi:hypothetical protein H5410_030797 [Solanum commersonii]|uniref:Uncharacterized protein n=1 Tax=Solanum commersonii TaxID=4109 RepID=A0A9J5YFB2_SOLCO|nr:hypothetical protein H5410_030797 [Solanum commersonii]